MASPSNLSMIICMPERLDEFMDELNNESKKCISLYSDAKLTYFEVSHLFLVLKSNHIA